MHLNESLMRAYQFPAARETNRNRRSRVRVNRLNRVQTVFIIIPTQCVQTVNNHVQSICQRAAVHRPGRSERVGDWCELAAHAIEHPLAGRETSRGVRTGRR